MEKAKIFIAIIAIFIVGGMYLTSCQDKDDTGDTEKVEAKISAGILTRAIDTNWEKDDCIGLHIFKSGTNDFAYGKFNYKYSTEGSVYFNPDTEHVIYYPLDGSAIDFLGYYPYDAAMTEACVCHADVSDQSHLPAIDLMTSERFVAADKNTPEVTIKFRHRLSKLIFRAFQADRTTELPIEKVVIEGMNTSGTYQILTEALTVNSNSKKVLEATSPDKKKAEAIVMPREPGKGVTFYITSGGEEYTVLLSEEQEFKSGFKYTFNLVLNEEEVIIPVIKAIIQEWEDGGKIELYSKKVTINSGTHEADGFQVNDVIILYHNDLELTSFTWTGTEWKPETPLYWENIGNGTDEDVTLRAFYQRADALDDTQMPEIFLAEETVKRFGDIKLNFQLAPAKVRIHLKSEADPRDVDQEYDQAALDGAILKLPNYQNGYTLDKGVFTPTSQTGDIDPVRISGNLLWEALILPQTRSGKIAEITVAGNTYQIDDSIVEFKAGKCLEININVLKTAIIGFSASYTDWEQVPGSEYTAFRIVQEGTTSDFKKDDKLSLYYNYGNSSQTFISDFQYQGVTNDGKHPWLPVAPTNVSHWENLEDPSPGKYNFYGVSTLAKAPAGSNQMDDVMYAEHSDVARFGAINLPFAKKTAKINVLLESKDGTFSKAELASATITLPGYEIGAQYNGIVYNDNGTGIGTITPHKIADVNNNPAWTALFEPQTIAANATLIKITINGNEYELKLNSATTFDVAQQYTYTINLKKAGIGFTTSYSDWTAQDGGNHNVGLD